MSKPLAVLDIDGVVADVTHRLRHIQDGLRDWDAFFAEAADDTPIARGAELATLLAAEHDIVWLSGRPERLRAITESWLREHDFPAGPLRLRGDADRRPASVFKLQQLRIIDGDRPVEVFVDDDPAVIDTARAAGFRAVLADWSDRTEALDQAQENLGRS